MSWLDATGEMAGVSYQRTDVKTVELGQGAVSISRHVVTIMFQRANVRNQQEIDGLCYRLFKNS